MRENYTYQNLIKFKSQFQVSITLICLKLFWSWLLCSDWRFLWHFLVEFLRQEVNFSQSNDERTDDTHEKSEAKVKVSEHKFKAKESEHEASDNGEYELQHGDQLAIDLLDWRWKKKSELD